MFRAFQDPAEVLDACSIIGGIDKGEREIFEAAEDVVKRCYYTKDGTIGVFNACVYNNRLRIQIGFNTDMLQEAESELLALITEARRIVHTPTSIWYPGDNNRLDIFLSSKLPWLTKGHKTRELTAFSESFGELDLKLPDGAKIVPYESRYSDNFCALLDRAMAHTFEDPSMKVFTDNQANLSDEWRHKAATGECCVLVKDDEPVGGYVLKGAEIDLLAVSVVYQRQGFGRHLLKHAVRHILTTSDREPYLYCIENNPGALRFYLCEGMKVTGYSGYRFLE